MLYSYQTIISCIRTSEGTLGASYIALTGEVTQHYIVWDKAIPLHPGGDSDQVDGDDGTTGDTTSGIYFISIH